MPGQYTWVINQMNAVEDRPNSIVQAYMYNIITVPVSNFLCSSNLTASIQLSNVNLLLYCAPSIWSVEFAWVGLDQAQCAVNELKQRLCGSSFIRAAEGASPSRLFSSQLYAWIKAVQVELLDSTPQLEFYYIHSLPHLLSVSIYSVFSQSKHSCFQKNPVPFFSLSECG